MKKSILLISLAAVLSISASAQALRSGYFVENYRFGSHLNPAFAPDQGYVGLVTPNIQANINSNLGVQNLLYQNGNQWTTFLNPAIDAKTALSGFSENNFLSGEVGVDIFNIGVRNSKNYYTFDIGVRVLTEADIPYDMLAFLKQGMDGTETHYDIQNLSVNAKAYGQVAFGWSHEFFKGFRVGARAKALIGWGDASLYIPSMKVDMDGNSWKVNANAVLQGHAPGIRLKTNEDGFVSGVDIYDGYGAMLNTSSIGVVGDLGISYTFKCLQISAAISDVNFYNNAFGHSFYAESSCSVNFDGFQNLGDPDTKVDEQLTQLGEDFMKLIQLKPKAKEISQGFTIPTKACAGLRLSLFKDFITLGGLYNATFNQSLMAQDINKNIIGQITQQNVTGSVTLRPARWISLTGTYTRQLSLTGEWGNECVGFLFNLTPRALFNFFIGADYLPLHYSAGYVPLDNICANVHFGLCIPVGHVYNGTERR